MAVDFGRCISVTDDLPRRWKFITGSRVLAEALYRRWSTERGELPYDPDYGTDARDMIGETQSPAQIGEWQTKLAREAEKDERVEGCEVTVSYDFAASTAIITGTVTPSEGPTFRLVVAVDELTTTILRVT